LLSVAAIETQSAQFGTSGNGFVRVVKKDVSLAIRTKMPAGERLQHGKSA